MSSDVLIPLIGFGTYRIKSIEPILNAISVGYRHIDTAELYHNENLVKQAINLTHDKVYITTKISKKSIYSNEIEKSFYERLNIFGYIDLLLLHVPSKNCKRDWDTLIELYKKNKTRIGQIGVSNYDINDLDQLKNSEMMPKYNQIELSPFFVRHELVKYCQTNNINIIAHTSLTNATKLTNNVIINMANKYYTTPAEILLRWALKKGFHIIPKSENIDHIKQNLNTNNDLSDDDFNELDKCDDELQLIKINK